MSLLESHLVQSLLLDGDWEVRAEPRFKSRQQIMQALAAIGIGTRLTC
jgi:hypothetical protein